MKRSWKRILAGFMAACIIFGDSSLVYAAESTQPVVEASETEVIDETLDEEIIEEVVEQETLEEETVAEEETDVEEITDEESTDVEESTDAEESETEDLSDEETKAEEIVQDSLDNEMNVVEPSEEAVNAATTNSEAPETSAEEPEIYQISAQQEVFVNPLYEDVVSEEDILNGVSAVMTADELDIYTNDADIIEMVREEMVARNASITFAYEYEGTYDEDYIMNLVASYMDEAMKHTGNPKEGDYIRWNYAGGMRGISGGYSQGDTVHVELYYSMLYYTSAEMEAEMDTAVENLMNNLQLDGLVEYEQIRGIYDYICENVVYDYDNLDDEGYKLKYTPYAALINGTAVCQGYATLFYRMALETGLDARVITGDAGGAHAWNIVELDNQYYNLDSTWDAGKSTYSYFLKNMDGFTNHVRDEEYLSESFMAAYPMSETAYGEQTEEYTGTVDGDCLYIRHWEVENNGGTFDDAAILNALQSWDRTFDQIMICYPANYSTTIPVDIWNAVKELQDSVDSSNGFLFDGGMEMNIGWFVANMETADAPVKLDASVTIGGSECYGTVTVEDTIDIPANAHVRFESSKWKDDGGEIEKNDYQDIVDVFGQEYLEFDLMLDDQIIEERSDRYEWYKSEDGEHYNINADICLDNVERLEDGTYQMVSKQEDSDDGSDEEVDDDTFVLNKVYSTGTSDEWQDLYYTYYFTPEEDGYYGVKGDFYWISVHEENWYDIEASYLKFTEEGNIERYYYLESGVKYIFEFNIGVEENSEEYYQLVKDTEGENLPVITVSGEPCYVEAGKESVIKLQVSEAGLYFVAIDGEDYYIQWEEIIGNNDYATGNVIYFAEPGYAYIRIDAEEAATVELKSTNPQTISINEEVIVPAATDVCYEVDVENQDVIFIKKNSSAFELIGVDADGEGRWIDNYWFTENDEEWLIVQTPSEMKKLMIFFEGKNQSEDETMLVTDNYQFENQLTDWSGTITVPANGDIYFEYTGDVYGDYFISEPLDGSWDDVWFESLCESNEIRALWDTEELDGVSYKGYTYRSYDSDKELQSHMIFKLFNYTNRELTFELKTNEDFEIWTLYDEGDGHTEVDVNSSYYDNDYNTNYSYYTFTPETTGLYNLHYCNWVYRVSDRRLMPEYNVILEAGEEYLIRFYDTYGMETTSVVECSGTDVRFTELEPVKIFTPTVSGDYYIEVPGTLKLWNNETLSFDNITTKEKIALEAGETYIFWARNGEGQIGLKNDITVLDYDYYQALIASGGSVSIVDGVLQIKEPIFGGFTFKEALLSLLGLGSYSEQPREAFMKANQYWVGETGTFAAAEYYRLSADGTLTDCADDSVTAGDILVVKYEPEIVWVDSMEVSVDKTVLSEGETAQISVEVAPATEKYDFKGTPEIRFESSDPEIAEVDSNGVVTPHGTGKVTITVYADEDLRYQEGLEDQILSQSIELTVTGEEFTVLDYDFLQAFIASGGSVSLNADGSLKIEQKSAGWNLISKIASFFGITIYKDIPTENYVEANHYWVNEKDGSFIPTGYYDLDGNDISEQEVKVGGYAIVKYEPEYVWVDHLDMEVEDDVLTAGESTTLTVTPYAATEKYGFNSEPEIRLVSTNPEIANILPDGTIETYKAGTVLIRAYADVAAKHALGISDTVVSDYVVITVEPAPITFAYEILDDGTACITGYEGSPSKVIEIPSEIDGYPVTAIGELAFLDCTDLENVTLPDSIESIHYLAFKHLEDDYYMNLDVLFYASKGSYAYEWAKSEGYKVMDPTEGPYAFIYGDNGDETITITDYVGDLPSVLSIPSTIDGYTVTGIGFTAFMGCTEITELVIPDSVSSIDNAAFRQCSNLKKVTLPAEMYSIGSFAFGECFALEELILPEGITYLANAVIWECDSLTSITLPDSVETIEYHAISHCDNLEEVIIPDSVMTIAEYGIFNCPKLKEVQLPNSIESIGEFTFYQGDLEEDSETYERMDITIYASRKHYAYEWATDRGFTVVDSEENPYEFTYESTEEDPITWRITGIDDGTASGNLVIPETIDGIKVTEVSGLSVDNINGEFSGTLTLPSTLRVIHDNAFKGNSKLTGTVVIPSGLTYVGTNAFEGTGLTIKVECEENSYLHDWAKEQGYEYEIVRFVCDDFVYEVLEDNTAKILGRKEFEGDTLTIPAKLDGHAVSEIGEYAFENYENLCELRLECEETLKSIGNYAFRNCSSMWSFEIPENVVSIGDGAFYGTSDWWILEIPESVTSIGEEAFGNVYSIYRVYLSDNVTFIGDNAFTSHNYGENNKEDTLIYCAKGSYAYGWASKNGYNIYDTTAEREYQLTYTVLDEAVKTAAITGYTGEAGGTLVIPAEIDGYTVVEIADCAFDSENEMPECIYGDSINFTGLELPDTLVRIGEQAFQSCKGLTGNLVIPNSVKEIGACAFGWCNNLNGALIIPNTIEKVGSNAFNGCAGFTSLSLGTGLSTIEYYAFANCRNITGKLVIPENITTIADGAFVNCFNLTEVHMPDTLEYIEGMCFYDEMKYEPLDVTIYASRRYYPYKWAGEYGFDRVDTIPDQYFFTYEDINGEDIRITGIDGDAKGELIIPETIDGFTVTEIGENAFANCVGFKGKLEIPNTVTLIDNGAFSGCTGLTGIVKIPQSVTSINAGAFFNCTGIDKVYITEYTGYINDDAFMYDPLGGPGDEYEDRLLDIIVICDKDSYAYEWARNLGYQIDTETALAVRFTYEVLENGTARITKYNGLPYYDMEIPAKLDGYVVSEIGDYAFEECGEIYGTLRFPDTIVKIGEGAFSWCNGLYRVELPDNLEFLGEGVFFGLSDLSKVFVSETVTWIGDNAFSKHDDNGGIINQELTIYCTTGSYAHEWATANGFRTFDFNLSGDYQFTYDVLNDGTICITGYNGTPGKNLVIPQIVDGYTVTKIGSSAFEGGFEFSGSLLLPNTLKEIGDWAFSSCENISGTLTIPDSVETIGAHAFENCYGLETVYIGNNVEYIGEYAFLDSEWSENLDITIYASRKHYAYSWADEFGFTVVDTEEIPYEFTYEEIDWDAVRITGIDNGVAEGDLVIPSTIDGYIVKEIAGFNPENYKGEFSGTLTIPSTVRVIADEAFKGNQKLTGTVVLPPHLESIGENVFEGCNQLTVKVKCVKDSYLYEVALANDWEIELYQCTSDGYTYEVLLDGTARITGFTGSLEFENTVDLIIPEKVDNYVVTEVGDAAFRNRCEFNGKLILPETLKKIGDYAFNCCCGINGEVVIPDSVTEIGEGAFYYASVWRLTLPDNLKEIKARAFACTQLDERVIIPDKVTTIGEKAFAHDAITRLYVPNSVAEIADDAFYEMCGYWPLTIFCEKDSYAYNWAKEHDVEVVDLTSNGEYTINYVVIDENWKTALVTGYEGEAGGDLVIPTEIDGYKVVAIADNAFEGAYKFTGKLVLPEGLLNIGSFAFNECKELTGELIIPSTVGTIREYAFSGLENITGKLVIPDSVSLLGEFAFNYCPNITELYVGNGLTKIDYDAFSGCKALKTVVLSENLKEIAGGAFCECNSLEDVYLPNSLERIDERAFSTYDENGEDVNLDVTIHASRISYAYEWAVENGFDVVDIDAGKNLYYYEVIDSEAKTIRITGIDGKPEKDFAIPETYKGYTVTEIGDCAFVEYEEDESRFSGALTIPNTITSIGDHAFEGCSGLTGTLLIPDSVTYMANGAFVGCSGFETLTLSNNLEVIPESAFLGMTGLKGNIVIPDKVTEIHLDAFSNCSGLTGVHIPDSVTYIDTQAFFDYENEGNLNIKIYCNENSYAHEWANDNGFEAAVGESFEVTLVTNGGTIAKDDLTEYIEGVGAVLPTEVTKSGYTFEGWYTDEECTGERVLSIGKEETGAKTFYAKWTLDEYTITYHEKGGALVDDAVYNIHSETITLPVLEREAYVFAGWYDNASFAGEKVTEIPTGSTGNKVFYAKWTAEIYSIKYHTNGGTLPEGTRTSYTVEFGTITFVDPTRKGYEFEGWYDNSACISGKVTEIPAASMGNVEIYAKWKPIVYSIEYVLNDDLLNIAENPNPVTYTIETETFELTDASRRGYESFGWYSDEGCTKQISEIEKGTTGNLKVYAYWEPIPYQIEYVFNTDDYELDTDYDAEYTVEDEVVLVEPSRKGYDFAGWYLDESLKNSAGEKIAVNTIGDKVFYAKWTPTKYYITYDVDGGKTVTSTEYTIETNTFELPTTTKEGYKFLGWSYDENVLSEKVTTVEKGTVGNFTLYAHWEALEYSIEYNVNGGNEIADTVFTVESAAFDLQTPTRTGYDFAGWYTNSKFTGDPVTKIAAGSIGNKVFYAKWTAIKYCITYDVNGGNVVADTTFTVESATFDLPKATRAGYTFAGWYLEPECRTQITKVEKGKYTDSFTVYADWTENPYNIIYVVNKGVLPEGAPATYGTSTGVEKLPEPTRRGYEFLGWYTTRNFRGEAIDSIAVGETGNKTIYANWERINYPICYELNDTEQDNNGDIISLATNAKGNPSTYHVESTTITLKAPTRGGYTFKGWYYCDMDQNQMVRIEKIVKGSFDHPLTLYCEWEPTEYNITYVLNGGVFETEVKKTYSIKDDTVVLAEPSREGYEFAGWYTNAKFGEDYKVTEIEKRSTGNKTFYAKWTPIEYTIEYHNEDEISYANYTIESKTITLPVLKKAGYTFEGWYEAENGTGTPVTVIPAKSTGDKNFYAKWSLIEYTIEYHNAEIDDATYTVASGVVTLPVLEREGYVFEGWYAAQNFKGESITEIAANSTGDKNFYAKWSLEKYVINCDLRADEKEVSFDFVLPETYDYETAVTLPEAYRFGYKFLGWFTKDENGNEEAIEVIESGNTGDIDIFAKWNWSVDFVTEINTKSLNIEDNESAIPTIIVPYGETVNVNMSLTAIQDGHAIGHYVQPEDIQIVIAKGLYDEVITEDDLNSEFTQNIINGSNGTGYDFEVNADKYVYVDENGNEVYYTVAMVISGADYDKLYAPYASFRVKEAPQPLPINDSIEWSGISSLETGLTYNKLVNPLEDDSMKHLDDLLEKLFANTDAETREELKTNGTLTFKGVKNTDAVLKSGTYTIEYNYNGTEAYETSAEAALKINYGVFSAAGVQYKGLYSKETDLDMIADAGAIACPVNGINSTPYVSGVSIVPMFKTPWGDILTANELPKEEYDVSVRCVKVDKSENVEMDTALEFAYSNDSCDVEVTTKDINPTKTLTKTIYLETTITLCDGTASIIIPTTIKNFKVYNGGSNAIESISWLREGDSETERDASSYLYPIDTAEARQVKFTFTVKDYAGDGVENMYGKVKWSTSNKAVASVSVDKTTGQPKITIPKKAQGVAEIKAVTTDAAKKEFSFRIVVADLGVRVENTKLTLNSKASESVGVVNVYPNVLAQSLPKDENDQTPFSVKVEFVNKKGTEKDEIAEALFNVENMIEQSGEVKLSFEGAQTLKKNHTTYLKVTQTIPGYGEVESSPIKVTISDKCTLPTVSGKVTANYNKAMAHTKTFAEVLVTTAEPLSNEVDLNEALKLMDTKDGLIKSNVKKVSDTQYRVELKLTKEIAKTEFKNAKQFYVQFEALCAGYRVPSETKQIKVPIVNVAPTFELSSDTPMFYKDNEVEFRNVKINVKVPTDVTVENIELTKDALKQFEIVEISDANGNLEVTVRPNAKSSGGNVQFNIKTAEYEKPLTSTKLKITGRTITSEAITLYDNNTNQKAANSFTFYYSLLGKERISLRAESQYLSEIVNTYDGEIEIDVQAANTATATLLNKKAVVVESDGENVVITATKDAFDSKLKKNTSCKLKIALIAKDGNNAKSTKVQNITLTFNPKSNNTSVTLKAAEKLNVAAKDTAVSVKPTIKYLPMGAIVEDITFKNPADEQRFVIDKGENGAFTIKLAEGGVDVPSGKNTIAVTYDIRTVSGELTKVDTSVVVNVVQTAAIKSNASTLTLYNSVIGPDFGKFITFTESKFGGKISVEIDEASREMLKDAGIRIVEEGKGSDYEGASDMNETVKYKVYVAKDLNRGQEKTYTVKAKVLLYNSATKKGVPTTYNTSFKVKLAK